MGHHYVGWYSSTDQSIGSTLYKKLSKWKMQYSFLCKVLLMHGFPPATKHGELEPNARSKSLWCCDLAPFWSRLIITSRTNPDSDSEILASARGQPKWNTSNKFQAKPSKRMSSWVMMAFPREARTRTRFNNSWKQMYRIAQPAPSPVCTGKLARGVLKESMPACIMLLHSHSKGSPLSHVCWVFQLRAPGNARDTCLQQKHTKTICQG